MQPSLFPFSARKKSDSYTTFQWYSPGFVSTQSFEQQSSKQNFILSRLYFGGGWGVVGNEIAIDHFTVMSLVPKPLNESEADIDLVLIQTSFLFLWKTMLKNTR